MGILFDLNCENGHTFEAWFASSDQYEKQNKKNLINCPLCNSNKIRKALMAPNLRGTKKANQTLENIKAKKEMKKFNKNLKEFKKFIEKKIYYGETKSRPIRGETTKEQESELIEEGIPI